MQTIKSKPKKSRPQIPNRETKIGIHKLGKSVKPKAQIVKVVSSKVLKNNVMLQSQQVIKLGKGITSIVYLNKSTNIVTKKIVNRKFDSFNIFEREVYWLQYLNEKGYDWCPKYVSSDPKSKVIKMTFVGHRINKQNAPENWRQQLTKILQDLRKDGICHNDIKGDEVLVKGGKLYLIDYGWMSIGQDWSCGGKFDKKMKPYHDFHDHSAISRISKKL